MMRLFSHSTSPYFLSPTSLAVWHITQGVQKQELQQSPQVLPYNTFLLLQFKDASRA